MGLGKSAARSFILSTLLDSTRLDSTVPLDSREKGDSPFVLSLSSIGIPRNPAGFLPTNPLQPYRAGLSTVNLLSTLYFSLLVNLNPKRAGQKCATMLEKERFEISKSRYRSRVIAKSG